MSLDIYWTETPNGYRPVWWVRGTPGRNEERICAELNAAGERRAQGAGETLTPPENPGQNPPKPPLNSTLDRTSAPPPVVPYRVAVAPLGVPFETGFRQVFADAPVWRDLARQAGFKLPPHRLPADERHCRLWLKRLGVPVKVYLAWSGEPDLSDFQRNNPTWPLWAWVGLVLEGVASGELPALRFPA